MAEYTIDKLAQKAHTTVRNVRSYQDKGLLPPPRREGRSGVYSEIHLARLRLIGQLLSRGYTTANIGELLAAWEKGQDVAQLIGLENAITTPFQTEVPSYVTLDELYAMFGTSADQKALELSLRLGVIEPEGDRFKVSSPQLLQAGAELAKHGLPLHDLLVQVNALRGDVERIANRFVQLIIDQVFNKYGEDQLPPREEVPRLAELVRRLRPMAQTVVDVELARALENIVSSALSDRVARVAGKMPAKGRRRGARGRGSEHRVRARDPIPLIPFPVLTHGGRGQRYRSRSDEKTVRTIRTAGTCFARPGNPSARSEHRAAQSEAQRGSIATSVSIGCTLVLCSPLPCVSMGRGRRGGVSCVPAVSEFRTRSP